MTLGAARVIYQINDLSLYVDQMLRGYVVAIVKTQRGPMWRPIPIATLDDYERIFGLTFAGSTDPMVLKTGLLQGAKFIVVRVAHCENPSNKSTLTATKSTVTLYDQGSTPTAGKIESKVGPFVFTAASAGSFTQIEESITVTFESGVNDTIKLSVGSDAAQTITLTGEGVNISAVASQINDAATDITCSIVDQKLVITADDVLDSLTIWPVANDAYSTLNLVEGTYAPSEGNNSLKVSMNGGTLQTFTFPTGRVTSIQAASLLSDLTGGGALSVDGKLRIVSSILGPAGSVRVDSSSTCEAVFDFDNNTHIGTTGVQQATLQFTAKDPGLWGDSVRIITTPNATNPEEAFDVTIDYGLQGGLNESFVGMTMDPNSDHYAPAYIKQKSMLVDVVDLYSTNVAPSNNPALDGNGVLLAGGDDGLLGFNDADYIGDPVELTGLYASQQTDLSIDIIIPGTSSIHVLQALVAFCENTGAYVAYCNPPAGMLPPDVVDWRMGTSYGMPAFDSHRLAIFFGRPLIYDSTLDRTYHVSNLGMFAACIANTDTNYDYIYAPVGPRRGVVDLVEGLDFNVAEYPGYQDMFAEYGINSLIIQRQKGIEGAMFWEQYTTQRAASALRDLNVVRFLTMMRAVLLPVLRTFLFEPNTPLTWREVYRVLQPVFQQWKDTYSIYDYLLQTDRDAYYDGGTLRNAVLNTGLSIDQGIYKVRVFIQPTRAIRYIMFTVGVTRTGQAFSEYEELSTLPGTVKS
jgi:hypothetical protein